MKDLSGNFGLLIAYVLPGFITLWTFGGMSPTVQKWLSPSPTIPAGLESIVFVLLASVAAGMAISALRWAVIDTLHELTGLARPEWDDARLSTHLQAYDAVVEWHYRHYQFYANTAVALALGFVVQLLKRPYPGTGMTAGFLVLEALFLATSRDNLRKYYARSVRLLGSPPRIERSDVMSNGSHPPKGTKQSASSKEKPAAGGSKEAVKK